MPIRIYKPTSPGRRFMSVSTFEEITKKEPEKSLIEPLKKHAGRNNRGRITTRHRGGGNKRFYRIIDFKRNKTGIPAKVAAIEYDPNRSARIALLHLCGWREALHAGADRHESRRHGDLRTRSRRFASATRCRCATFRSGRRFTTSSSTRARAGSLCRSAGTSAQLMAKSGDYAQIRMPSGEVRLVHLELHGDARAGRQRRSRKHRDRQSRPQPTSRATADGSWLGDESARPSARWRRGKGADRRSAKDRSGASRYRPGPATTSAPTP